ncbi:G-alpha-domain-containing protein [Ramaria rubella]|nr:G-alpha-domain-containing protein [Ramaria rubella]
MPRVRGRSNASLSHSLTLDTDDPLSRALQPPPDETPAEREDRIRAEREAKRVSDEIDEELRKERAAAKRKKIVRVLLLGQSESGKSTTLKNFQIHYAPQSWREERACWRAVIQLNLIRSVALVLDTAASAPPLPTPQSTTRPTGPSHHSTRLPTSEHDATSAHTMPLLARYAPLQVHLARAERILQRRLAPSEMDEPGDYRSFAAMDTPPPLLNPTSSSTKPPLSLPSPTQHHPHQEFFVRHSWKSRFLRRVSNGSGTHTSNWSPTATTPTTTSPNAIPIINTSTPVSPGSNSSTPSLASPSDSTPTPLTLTLPDPSVDPTSPASPTDILHACVPAMKALWGDGEVRDAVRRGWRGGSGTGVFLPDAERIGARDYEPSDDDVIRARLRTMGVQEHRFTFERGFESGREWRVYDIGGARSQRASWLSFFDDMDAIIFLAPISCFDETLLEDRRVNRLEDSITLWRTLCRSPLLSRVQLVLFLNKVDLLSRKIATGVQIARHVTSFGSRSNDVETVCKYFKQKFKEIQRQYSPHPRPYYVYLTSVTDTRATGITLGIVREGILRSNLHKADFL